MPEEVQKYFQIQEGETVEYHYDKVVDFIEEVSNYHLEELANRILLEKDYKFLLS